MEYSIVIPVFNKAELTRNCLQTLRPTLEGAGEGEVIVVDNASSDETPEMLRAFPWIRLIRNERNLGFAAANNQGARVANGRFLVLLNNDTQGFPGWLAAMLEVAREPEVGAVGARLLFPDQTIQHAGVVVARSPFGRTVQPFHYAWHRPGNDPDVGTRREYQIVTGACLVTPLELYEQLGGLDEIYWNGNEDVDYCLKVRARGLKVVYEPRATLYHFESQSGVQRFRKVWWNVHVLSERWQEGVANDAALRRIEAGRIVSMGRTAGFVELPVPASTVIVHGEPPEEGESGLEAMIRNNHAPVAAIERCSARDAVATARRAMAVRGNRFVVLLRAGARLSVGWLDELIAQVTAMTSAAAATFSPHLATGEGILAADAGCTLLWLERFPQHLELRDFDTLDGAVADLLLRTLELERGTRSVSRQLGTLSPAPAVDAAFEAAHGMPLAAVFDTAPAAVERILRAHTRRQRGLVSIVTLSWNAPTFTQKALESIRVATSEPYEVIVVDNGSGPETRAMLATIDDPHVRVIYNPVNRGYAGGNNDGIAAARGEHVVLLNNDVVVTEGWLDALLAPFGRVPGVGVTAPRSNMVVGHQQLTECSYTDEAGLAAFAARRSEDFRGRGYLADRAIGLCLCIDRTVLEQVGGLDERFGLGNFEDDDFCIRVRAAGYEIYVCEDAFIHHFGSRSFAANNVDYTKTMHENWAKFSAKWGFGLELPAAGYEPHGPIARGFDRARHFVEIAAKREAEAGDAAVAADCAAAARLEAARVVFYAKVGSEVEWKVAAEFVSRFARAFKAGDGALFAVGVFGGPDAAVLGRRAERVFARLKLDPAKAGDIDISDEFDAGAWHARFEGRRAFDVSALEDRSPSALRRLIAREFE